MYIPQCVSYIKKKRGSNIGILKRGKNIMKCELQIGYTNIISADLCVIYQISLNLSSQMTSKNVTQWAI